MKGPAGQIAAVDALAHGQQVRLNLVEVGGQHLAGSTKARHHFVEDKHDVVLVADLANLWPIPGRRRELLAHPDHWLSDDCGHRLRARALDYCNQVLRTHLCVSFLIGFVTAIHVRRRYSNMTSDDVLNIGLPTHRLACNAHRLRGVAVIAADPADDLRLCRLRFGPRETSDHKSHLVGLGASRREGHMIQLHREQPGETSRNLPRKRMSELVKGAEVLQLFGLLAHCSDKPSMTMTEVHTVELRAAIEGGDCLLCRTTTHPGRVRRRWSHPFPLEY